MCSIMFATRESATRSAQQLVSVAADYGLDGWLINIENAVSATKRCGGVADERKSDGDDSQPHAPPAASCVENLTFFLEQLTTGMLALGQQRAKDFQQPMRETHVIW